MATVYAKFGFEVSDKFPSVINEGIELMQQIGEIHIVKTKCGTVTMEYQTPSSEVVYLEEKSGELCDKLEPFAKDFQAFFQKESDKIIYKCICFVRTTYEEEPVIKIDKRLLKLAYMLQTEIDFDGFSGRASEYQCSESTS